MIHYSILFIGFLCFSTSGFTQTYFPTLEPCPCLMKVDSRLIARCGNLVVPENRTKAQGRKIKIPYVFVRRPDQDSTKNITLYTTGGPGYATIPVGDSLGYNSGRLSFGGFVLFDQRGTKNATPCLDCEGIDEAIRTAYLSSRPKDSLVCIAVTKCRAKFISQGVDLSAYNTIESAADIHDLIQVLGIDSITLFGISYSGGLMLTVARNYSEGIKSLLLNSPLPAYVNYEEHALFNHNEALDALFDLVESDSLQYNLYPNIRQKFREYFTSLSGKKFYISYFDKKNQRRDSILYTKNELLDVVINRMNNSEVQTVPGVIQDLIAGQHEKYITEVLDNKFAGNPSLSYGMRLSVYCSEQIAYSDKNKLKQQDKTLPWLAGYPFNNVNHTICECWKVKPEPAYIKTPVYSSLPALVTAGALDPWTRPFYNRLIKRTIPNAQLLIIQDKAHGAGFGSGLLTGFMADPYKKLISGSKNVIVE